jgi:hypothetical protein
LLFWLWIVTAAFPQGQVIFDNRVAGIVVAPIYDLDPADPHLVRRGNTVEATPPGSQAYAGPLLAGSGFSAQLFGGTTNTPAEQLQALGVPTVFRSNQLAGFVLPPPQALTVAGVPEGHCARLQLRAWNNRNGTLVIWEQAANDRLAARGESAPFISLPLGGISNTPPNLVGLESFNIALPASEPTALRINFQPAGAALPPGYLGDYGDPFADRGNGWRYGWNFDLRAQAHDRNSSASPDQRYDTFVFVEPDPAAAWEAELPNGIYQVHLAAGDATDLAGVYRIGVENVLTVHGTPSAAARFVEGVTVVGVADGRLTIKSAPGSFRNRICFVDIVPVPPPRLEVNCAGADCVISFDGILNTRYEMQRSFDLRGWVSRGWAGAAGSRFSIREPASGARAVFRTEIVLPGPVQSVYSNDFQGTAGPEWSTVSLTTAPSGTHRFLGRFGADAVTLALSNLPPHSKLSVAFDLYIVEDWDSSDHSGQRDTWALTIDGGTKPLHASFSNATGGQQSYPAGALEGSFPARTGARENNTLGYGADSTYRVNFTVGHAGPSTQIRFEGRASQPLSRQSWGLDNVRVAVELNPY